MRIDLGICAISGELPLADEAAQAILEAVAKPFAEGSSGDIELAPRIVDSQDVGIAGREAMSSDALHDTLERITGRQRGSDKVTSIGLILAGRFKPHPDWFGVMFDHQFVPNSSVRGWETPREGCAVFLSAIAQQRAPADVVAEYVYTAIHELSHVFNLQHSPPPSFMAFSASRTEPFKLDTREFNALQRRMLESCSTSRHVWPGGARFGDLGPFGESTNDLDAPASRAEPLRLKIGASSTSFYCFEPVELDVELAIAARARLEATTVPDTLDPGYATFIVWIEEPDGERRRLHSPRHYCEHPYRVHVAKGRPFRRDISVFGESGGFTFRKSGLHRVQVTYAVDPGRVLRSNVLELHVKPWHEGSLFEASSAVFRDRDLGQLLYYRLPTGRRLRKMQRLADFCEAFPRQPSAAMAHYAMGRALAQLALDLQAGGAPNQVAARKAVHHLRKALSLRLLGDHRHSHAECALTAVDSNAGGRRALAR